MGIIAQSGCATLILRDIQNPNGHNPKLRALADFLLSKWVGLTSMLLLLYNSISICLLL